MMRSLAKLVSMVVVLCLVHATPDQMKSDPTGAWGGTMTTEAGTSGLEITLSRDSAGDFTTLGEFRQFQIVGK